RRKICEKKHGLKSPCRVRLWLKYCFPLRLPCDSLLNHSESVQVQLRVAVGFQFWQFWQLWQFWQSPPSQSLFNPGQPEAGLCGGTPTFLKTLFHLLKCFHIPRRG